MMICENHPGVHLQIFGLAANLTDAFALRRSGFVGLAHTGLLGLRDCYCCLKFPALAALAFYLHCRWREHADAAADRDAAAAPPWKDATLKSLGERADEHRVFKLARATPRERRALWRAPLAYDARCAAARRALLPSTTTGREHERLSPKERKKRKLAFLNALATSWDAALVVPCADGSRREEGARVRGRWRATPLLSHDALFSEGIQQHNCLRHVGTSAGPRQRRGDLFWSLRFEAAANDVEQLQREQQLADDDPALIVVMQWLRSHSRITVQLRPAKRSTPGGRESARVVQAKGPCNLFVSERDAGWAATRSEWAAAAGIDIVDILD